MRALFAALALWSLAAAPGFALDPEERLADPAAEARARALSRELRCLVCKGQTIDDSDAPIARALRALVRERIAAGDDDAAVLAAVTERYGDSVRLNPRLTPATALLWAGPFLVVLVGAAAAVAYARQARAAAAAPPLSAEEEAALRRALERD